MIEAVFWLSMFRPPAQLLDVGHEISTCAPEEHLQGCSSASAAYHWLMRRTFLAAVTSLLCALLALATSMGSALADDDALLAALALPGHVGLMRHARAPGTDDP